MPLQRVFLTRDKEHLAALQSSKPAGVDMMLLYAGEETLQHFRKWVSRQSAIGLDIETNHFDPYCGQILLTSIYAEDKVITFDNQTVPVEEMLTTELLKDVTVVAHNLKFETVWFLKHNVHFRKTHCTMLAEQKMLAGSELRNDIVSVLQRRGIPVPAEMDKTIREDFGNGNYTKPEFKHILYNQGDVLELLQLQRIQEDLVEKQNMRFYIKNIQFPLIRTLAIVEMEGMVVDELKLKTISDIAENKMRDIAAQMQTWIETNFPTVDLVQFNAPVVKQLEALDKQQSRLIDRNNKCFSLKTKYEDLGKTHLKAYQVVCASLKKIAQDYKELDEKILKLKATIGISWTANHQVIALLEGLGCKPLPRMKDKATGTLKPSMAKAPRERWLLQNPNHTFYPLMKLYDEYMHQTKQVNSFGRSFLEKYRHPVTGKFHTSYKQGTVDTGRLASGNSDMTPARFNSQQLPPTIRECFGTDEGYLVATCDLSGAELITMCSLAQDHRLLELSKTTDLHSYFANLGWKAIYALNGRPWTEADVISKDQNAKKRKAYKPMMFGTVYGLRAPKAAETLNVSEAEGQVAIKTIVQEIPATMKMVNDAVKFAMKHGYIKHNDRTNSRRWFPAILKEQQGIKIEFMDRVAVDGAARNSRIQGTQADMLCEAMVVLQRFIDFYKLDIKILMQVHDELVVKFHPKYQDWFPERLKQIMTRTANRYLTGGVQMDADCKFGKTWTK